MKCAANMDIWVKDSILGLALLCCLKYMIPLQKTFKAARCALRPYHGRRWTAENWPTQPKDAQKGAQASSSTTPTHNPEAAQAQLPQAALSLMTGMAAGGKRTWTDKEWGEAVAQNNLLKTTVPAVQPITAPATPPQGKIQSTCDANDKGSHDLQTKDVNGMFVIWCANCLCEILSDFKCF